MTTSTGPVTGHRRWSAAVAAIVCAVLAVGTATPGTATTLQEHFEQFGTVVRATDGDTILVDVEGDGTTDPLSVRFIGVEAMSIYHRNVEGSYDHCHGPEAKEHLASILPLGTRVKLTSIDDSTGNTRPRLLRTVWKADADGDYSVNVVREMVTAGHVLWFPFGDEHAHNDEYHLLADRLATARRDKREGTIWDDDHCGSGPYQGAKLRVWAKSDADGVDRDNLNDEWVLIRNYESYDIKLTGWTVRDASQHYFTFPRNSWVPAKSSVTLHVGKGSRTDRRFYWGLSGPQLDNAGPNHGADGDGVYLLDPDEDLRAWSTWPCLDRCANQLAGRVKIVKVVYNPTGDEVANERLVLKNVSDRVVRLEGWGVRENPNTYVFAKGHRIKPGATLTLRVGRGKDTAQTLYWGLEKAAFPNAGGKAEVVNFRETVAHCRAWGDDRC